MKKPQLIALAGVARCGKDDLARPLVERGWVRLAYGDVIKHFFAPYVAGDEDRALLMSRLCQANPELTHEQLSRFADSVLSPFEASGLKADTFTENDAEKAVLRPILEHGGDLIYDYVTHEYFRLVDAAWSAGKSVVNPRLVRAREGELWRKRGGEIILIDCLHREAASQWEKDCITQLKRSGHITRVIGNWGTAEEWQKFAEDFAEEITP